MSGLRVIAGIAGGTRLLSPKGLATRPTADRIKESLFNIISADLEGAAFLDLYAGSGGIGVEALSRGAARCVFVENGRFAFDALIKNLEHTRLTVRAETYKADVFAAVRALAEKQERFNIIFMDPPYENADDADKLSALFAETGLLAPEGVVICEHGADLDLTTFKNINLIKQKCYGRTTTVSFWKPV